MTTLWQMLWPKCCLMEDDDRWRHLWLPSEIVFETCGSDRSCGHNVGALNIVPWRPPLLASTFLGNVGHGSKDESRVTLHVSSRDDVSCR